VHIGAPEFAEYSDVHYGLGFRSHRYRGEGVVWHGGGFTGTNTLMMLLPDRGVGVAVLANSGMVPLFAPHILANYVFDRVCGKEPATWLDRFRERRRTFVAQQEVDRQAGKASRRPSTQPGRDLGDYAGDYEHPGYGRITIMPKANCTGRFAACPSRSRIGTTIRSSCPRHPSRPAACYPVSLPSHFPPTAKAILRVWQFRSSHSSRTSPSPALRLAIARLSDTRMSACGP